MPYSTVLFDLDGTLTDPSAGITNSLVHALDCLGLPHPSADQLRGFIGPPLPDALATLGLDASTCESAIVRFREYFKAKGMFENEPYPGIEALLSTLRERGLRLAVATSKPTVFAEPILKHFGLDRYFDCVAGAELDRSRQYKDEIIGQALRSLAVAPAEDVIMVGDREHDVVGAHRSGLRCVGVLWGFGSEAELTAAGADRIVADRPELLRALGGNDLSAGVAAKRTP